MKTPTAAAADRILRDLLGLELDAAALPLPGRAPSLADVARYEAHAIEVRDILEPIIARRTAATVRPGRAVAS